MEYLFLSLILPIFTVALFFYAYKSNHKSNLHNLPPGSFGWPIIGETLEFLYWDPNKFLGDRMKKYSPKIFKTKIFGEPVVVLCGIAGHKFIASNEASLFVSWRPPSMQKLLRSSYQKVESAIIPRESEVHAIRAPGFIRPEALVQYVEGMDFMVQEHLDMYWANKQKVEVYNLVQLLIMNLATRFFAGLDQDHDRVAKISKLMATMSPSMTSFPAVKLPGTEFHRAQKAADDLIKEFQVLIKEKKEAKSRGAEMHDLLSYMIFSTDSSGQFMPELEVAGKFMGMLSASFSSPAIATTFLMKYLGQRPDVYAQVRRGKTFFFFVCPIILLHYHF